MQLGSDLQTLKARAESGDAQAQYHYDLALSDAKDGEFDSYELREYNDWVSKSAQGGYALAQLELGRQCDKGGSWERPTKAIEWYTKAAKQGNVYAECHLAFKLVEQASAHAKSFNENGKKARDKAWYMKYLKDAEFWYTKAINHEDKECNSTEKFSKGGAAVELQKLRHCIKGLAEQAKISESELLALDPSSALKAVEVLPDPEWVINPYLRAAVRVAETKSDSRDAHLVASPTPTSLPLPVMTKTLTEITTGSVSSIASATAPQEGQDSTVTVTSSPVDKVLGCV